MKRFSVFASISLIGAVIDFILAYSLLQLLNAPGWAALAAAMTVSASVVYLLHARITFADRVGGATSGKGWAGFLAITVAVYLGRLAVFEALIALETPVALALAIALVASALATFTLSNTLIFKARASSARIGGEPWSV